jgi:RNA polymerase sigma-70 factor (ECF subfamily)
MRSSTCPFIGLVDYNIGQGTTVDADSTLIAAVLAGDSEQFGQLARRYRAGLWRAAKSRLGDSDKADDAVQEALLNAYKWLSSYDSRFSFRTWLWTILLNQCRRSLGKTAKRREQQANDTAAAPGFSELVGREACPHESALIQERAEVLERLLDQLPEAQADALRMRFFGDLKFQEIADVQQCSLGTAKNRVRAGLLQMAKWLGEDDAPLVTGFENKDLGDAP